MKKKKERSRDREEEREREGACVRERWRLEDEGASSLNFLKKPDPCFFYKRSLCCYFLHLLQTRAIFFRAVLQMFLLVHRFVPRSGHTGLIDSRIWIGPGTFPRNQASNFSRPQQGHIVSVAAHRSLKIHGFVEKS